MGIVKYGAFVLNGEVDINNTVIPPKKPPVQPVQTCEKPERHEPRKKTHEEEIAELQADLIAERDEVRREKAALLKLKDSYIEQGSDVIKDAKKRAEAIASAANEEAEKIKNDTKTQCAAVLEQARIKGEEAGFKKGYDESVEQCRVILGDAKKLLEGINSEKTELFESYEKEIFETVLEIANKVTMNSVTAKDSRVVTKIIRQAAKDFRNSNYIKISLFKNEANEELFSDIDFVRSLVGEIPNVEVELLPDVDEGTVILDNGSEITDSSISTQLRMIAELGRGKYKDKPRKESQDNDAAEDNEESVEPVEKPRSRRSRRGGETD